MLYMHPTVKERGIIHKLGGVEDLIYSKAHDMYATSKEINYLWQLIKAREKSAVKSIEPSPASNYNATGVRGQKKEEVPRIDEQAKLRSMLKDLLEAEPHVSFWRSLRDWRSNLTVKQSAAILRGYEHLNKDKYPPAKKESTVKEYKLTPEEEADPNWTPWD